MKSPRADGNQPQGSGSSVPERAGSNPAGDALNYLFPILIVGIILVGMDWTLVTEYLVDIPSVVRGFFASF
jgi:hypothetical protein